MTITNQEKKTNGGTNLKTKLSKKTGNLKNVIFISFVKATGRIHPKP